MAEFRIDRLRFNWKGVQQLVQHIFKDDVVQYGGRVYAALVNRTAAASFILT